MTERAIRFIRGGSVVGGVLALVGYLTALCLVFSLLPSINPGAIWLFVGAFVGVEYCGVVGGGIAARFIYEGANAYASGLLLALSAALVPTFCLALPFALSAATWSDFYKILLTPLTLVLLLGGAPIVLLGLLYGAILHRREQGLFIISVPSL